MRSTPVAKPRKKPAYIWWATIFTSAGLLGWSIGGNLVWWAFLVPWVVYGTLVVSVLVGVFLIEFVTTLVVGFIEWQKEKEREHARER